MNKYWKLIFKKILKIFSKIIISFNIDLFINENKLLILMYHGVTAQNIPQGCVENYDGKHIFIDKFKAQLKIIGRYNIISMQQLQEHLEHKNKLPKNPLLITFDDGYKNVYDCAFPILKTERLHATVFICPKLTSEQEITWLDKIELAIANSKNEKINLHLRNKEHIFEIQNNAKKIKAIIKIKQELLTYTSKQRDIIINELEKETKTGKKHKGNCLLLNWEEIKELSNNGITIGSHSLEHAILPCEEPLTTIADLSQSKSIIENNIKKEVNAFAYPNGIYNKTTANLTKEAGYACALTTLYGKNAIKNPFMLQRIPVNNNSNTSIFAISLIFNIHNWLFIFRNLIK